MTTTHTKVAPGIYRGPYGYRAVVTGPSGGRKERRFPPGTDLHVIRLWRSEMRARLRFAVMHRQAVTAVPVLPRDLDGWCYLYVIAGDGVAKIGRALNPYVRLSELQTGHDAKMTLLVAVPMHASLESAIHKRFSHLRKTGEWFYINDELAAFVEDLQAGANPVNWVWSLERRRDGAGNTILKTHGFGRRPYRRNEAIVPNPAEEEPTKTAAPGP